MLPPPIINQSHLSKFSKLIFVSNVFYLVGLIVMIVIFILKILKIMINIVIIAMIIVIHKIVKIIIVMIIVRLPDPPTMARCKGGGEGAASHEGDHDLVLYV